MMSGFYICPGEILVAVFGVDDTDIIIG